MTKVKFCGLTRERDILAANRLMPACIGFVFAGKSKRYVEPDRAAALKRLLSPGIRAVGVFVNAPVTLVAGLLNSGVIDIAQLHGQEDSAYISMLRAQTDRPIWQAFRIETGMDVTLANTSPADLVLLDSGAGGTGAVFDWTLLRGIHRPYFLAGGLSPENAAEAVATLHPFGVDVSSGIETEGYKDPNKMAAFLAAVRKGEQL